MKTTNIQEWDLKYNENDGYWWELVHKGTILESYGCYNSKQLAIDDFKDMATHRGYTVID